MKGGYTRDNVATKALIKAEDLLAIQSATGKNYELVRGELREVVTGYRHGQVVTCIAFLLEGWRRETDAGDVLAEAGYTLERDPDTVRGPDISFVRKGRFPAGPPKRGFPEIAPDVAIEVRSPNDTWPERLQKTAEYLARGTRAVILVQPDEFAEVHRPGQAPLRLGLDEPLPVEDVLPGFHVKVSELFPR